MTTVRRFKSVWADARPQYRLRRSSSAAANAEADAESACLPDSTRQSLRALAIMRDRGHLSVEEFDRRRAALLASDLADPD